MRGRRGRGRTFPTSILPLSEQHTECGSNPCTRKFLGHALYPLSTFPQTCKDAHILLE